MAAAQSDEAPMEPADLVTAAARGVGEFSPADSASATATVIAAALLLASQANRRNVGAGAEPERPCTNEAQDVTEELVGADSQGVVSGEVPQSFAVEEVPQEQPISDEVQREPCPEELTQQELAAEGVYDDVLFVVGVAQEDTPQEVGQPALNFNHDESGDEPLSTAEVTTLPVPEAVKPLEQEDTGAQQDVKARRSEDEDEEVAEDEEVDEEEEDDGPPRLEEPSEVYEEEEEEDPELMERELPEEDAQSSDSQEETQAADAEVDKHEETCPSQAEVPVTHGEDDGRPDEDDEPEEFHDLPWDTELAPCDRATEVDREDAPFETLSLWDEEEDVQDTDELAEDIGADVAQETRLVAAALEPIPVSHDRNLYPDRSSTTDIEIAGEGGSATDSVTTPLHALAQEPAHDVDVA
jgi:hypothetical protein